MFRTRLISGIILVLIALVTIMSGGIVLAAVLCAISMIAYRELTKACGVSRADKKFGAPEIAGLIMTVLYYAALYAALDPAEDVKQLDIVYPVVMAAVVLTMLILLFIYVFTFPSYQANQIFAAMFAYLYAPVMLSFIYLIREGFTQGNYLVWFIFLCSWGSDTCAYAVGVLIGKHKMTPKLSPKKSVEGAVGGVAGAALLFVIYTHFAINRYTDATLPLALAAVLGAAGALVSMVGDLAASAIKRDHDIKDYGKLIPGHGGIMDRFDSVIIASPLIFIGLVLISRVSGI
ncbi:MAG: phosphatidate cytidylyltransferase [Lachnospiraceae bacterium]|nr:phosphatidate cytidylyltransferase [Lachnospiraceae bacterium]